MRHVIRSAESAFHFATRQFDFIPHLRYNSTMKVKTSVTLSGELVKVIDKYGKYYKNRSDFIEAAGWSLAKELIRKDRNKTDIQIINRNSKRLNSEALDVLEYQSIQ